MANNKNQHFVPQAYLRGFGIKNKDGDAKSIHLYAIGAGKFAFGASIRGQCSKNFFYGNVKALEDLLQHFEGSYGSSAAALERGEITTVHLAKAVQFFFLQFLRTPFQLEQRRNTVEEFSKLEINGQKATPDDYVFDPQREMQHQIYIFARHHNAFADLKPIVLLNHTAIPFITSDNPAIYTNRLYAQRYLDETAGTIQSGGIIYLPISPTKALFAYDGDVYQDASRENYFKINNENDVNRLNQLQVMRSSNALYFRSETDSEYVRRVFDRYSHRRKAEWHHHWTGIRDGEVNGMERYRTATPEDTASLEPRLSSVSPLFPVPNSWPSFVKFKMRPTGYTNESAIGFVRAAHAKPNQWESILPKRLPAHLAPVNRDVIYQAKASERHR